MTVTVHHTPHLHPPPAAPSVDRVDHAEQALRHFGGEDMDRTTATRMLSMWTARWMLTAADEIALLDRFPRVLHHLTTATTQEVPAP